MHPLRRHRTELARLPLQSDVDILLRNQSPQLPLKGTSKIWQGYGTSEILLDSAWISVPGQIII